MLFALFYDFLLFILVIVSLPKFLFGLIFQKKYCKSFIKKLGFGFPKIKKEGRPLIWIHAVSVGEVKAVAQLAKKLKAEPDKPILLISSVTETGHEEAKRSIKEADFHVFLPFDFSWIMSFVIQRAGPDKIILCETDFWYNFLRIAKKYECKITVVNGKISERSAKRFKKFSFLTRQLFSLIDFFCLQSQIYHERFLSIGIPKDRLYVTGNLKFDNKPFEMDESEKKVFYTKLGIREEDKVIVIGSSHENEEKILLEALNEVWTLEQNIKIIIVPRHPERFNHVENLLKNIQVPYSLFSQGAFCNASTKKGVILLDAMGLLNNCYQISTIAIVAGSYISSVGGHNILEPLWFGVPLIYGPFMHSQPDLVEAVAHYQAGLQLGIHELMKEVKRLLENQDAIDQLKLASSRLIASMAGSTDRTLERLKFIL